MSEGHEEREVNEVVRWENGAEEDLTLINNNTVKWRNISLKNSSEVCMSDSNWN